MKKIYYRSKGDEFEKGIFISYNTIFIAAGLSLFFTVFSLRLFDVSQNTVLTILACFALLIAIILFIKSGQQKINFTGQNAYDNELNNYFSKKISKKRGEKLSSKDIYGHESIIGDYEFNLIFNDKERLIFFYEKCISVLTEHAKDGFDHINIFKYERLKKNLNFKIKVLKKISEIQIN